MHHLVERPSENSYGNRFVIFQVVLPLQFFFLLSKLCKFWQHWFANFCFCQREPELPRFFISYHNSSRAKLYHSVYFNSILDIPRPILSLSSLLIFAFFGSAQNAFVSKNHQTTSIKQNSMQFPLIESRRVLLSFKIKIVFWRCKLFTNKRIQFV